MHRLAVGLCLVSLVTLASCGPSVSSASPRPSATAIASVAPSNRAPSPSSTTGQTDTPWGRIWDTLPLGFPAVLGSTPSDTTGAPASATLVVPGNAAKSVATSMQTALAAGGFRTNGLSGPLEDGSYVLDMAGAQAGCLVQLSARPLGGLTTVTVLYGTFCPHE